MRRSSHSKRGEKVVRLTIEVNEKNVLLSDFDLYHYPLNYWYIPLNEDDDRKVVEKYPAFSFEQSIRRDLLLHPLKDPEFYETMTKSWERIFDLSLEDDGWLFNKMDKKSIQATMWQIKGEQTLNVEEFIAR
jgi:Phage-related tail protein